MTPNQFLVAAAATPHAQLPVPRDLIPEARQLGPRLYPAPFVPFDVLGEPAARFSASIALVSLGTVLHGVSY